MRQRFLMLSASMGAGHDAVAGELAERLRARGHTVVIQDVLALLPSGVGAALRAGYRGAVRHAPRLYGGVYDAFLALGPERDGGGADGGGAGRGAKPRPGSGPLAALAERPLMRLVDNWQPDAVISTFHLSAQVTGRLRQRGELLVPGLVVLVDFAAHRGWLHPGNDEYLCLTEAAARTACGVTGRPAEATGPVVPRRFGGPPGTADQSEDTEGVEEAGQAWREEFGLLAPGRPAVLLSAGAWGVGTELTETARRLAGHGMFPVLLCGTDERLRRRASTVHGALALGWVADMAGLMSAASALIDNAAGQTAAQALAAGLPVIGYRPLPGHGAEGAAAMVAAGVSELATGPAELVDALDRVLWPGPVRDSRVSHGRALFRADAAQRITELATAGVRA